ncbi:unnamed protein product [Rotaria socialis]
MYRNLIILATIISQTTCDCLYPEWKKTCQKYCMDNQFYEIQLNQCYSMNPIQLRCRCSGKDLTEKIRAMVDNNDSESTSSIRVQSEKVFVMVSMHIVHVRMVHGLV